MTTFLPYSSFLESAECLDPVRRWKQVVEARQIVDALTGTPTKAGRPYRVQGALALCCRMWRGHVPALKWYANEMLLCVIRRRTHRVTAFGPYDLSGEGWSAKPIPLPAWVGRPDVHSSHRSRLLAKDPTFYGRYGWVDTPGLPYVWPASADEAAPPPAPTINPWED